MKLSPSVFRSLIFLFFSLSVVTMQAQEPKRVIPDSIRISLLTCASGEEIYSLFGHTAIRYENYTRSIDAVFNYGIFNFNAPNFILRFALGETDYQLGVTDYERFAAEYYYLERDVWQQELNLTVQEKEKLVMLLEENYRPENRIYRYNFFYDNCATRPRDLIEKSIDGTLQYADDMTDTDSGISFRDLLHKYSKGHPWSRFGMNLCMGSQADRTINRRLMMFVPFYVQEYFNQARIVNKEGETRPLVLNEEKIIVTGNEEAEQPSDGFTPMQTALLLLILTAAATIYGIRRKKTLWGIDFALFFAAGTAGMYIGIPCLVLPTSCRQSQLSAVCVPSASSFLPALYAEQSAKKEKKPLYADELYCFNTFYIALARNTAKISVSSVTFGTLFADTFCKQPNSHIR